MWPNTYQAQTQPQQILQKVSIKILLDQKILKPKKTFFGGAKPKNPKIKTFLSTHKNENFYTILRQYDVTYTPSTTPSNFLDHYQNIRENLQAHQPSKIRLI